MHRISDLYSTPGHHWPAFYHSVAFLGLADKWNHPVYPLVFHLFCLLYYLWDLPMLLSVTVSFLLAKGCWESGNLVAGKPMGILNMRRNVLTVTVLGWLLCRVWCELTLLSPHEVSTAVYHLPELCREHFLSGERTSTGSSFEMGVGWRQALPGNRAH